MMAKALQILAAWGVAYAVYWLLPAGWEWPVWILAGAYTLLILSTKPTRDQRTQQRIKETVRRVDRQMAQDFSQFIESREAQLVADMKELSAKSKLGYQKVSAAYLAGEGDPDYERHMKEQYAYMKAILNDNSNPERAAELRATLEHEYTSVAMSDWNKRQIRELLG
jgi:hypothetical protein